MEICHEKKKQGVTSMHFLNEPVGFSMFVFSLKQSPPREPGMTGLDKRNSWFKKLETTTCLFILPSNKTGCSAEPDDIFILPFDGDSVMVQNMLWVWSASFCK